MKKWMANSQSRPSIWKNEFRLTTPQPKWELSANFWESFFQPPTFFLDLFITQTFQKLILECLSNFYFWAKIAHFSPIFTPESFCKKASGKLICFPPLKLPFFPGAK
jgi:hypothetical protein